MLDAWIVEKLKEEKKIQDDRPRIYCPVPGIEDILQPMPAQESDPKEERGVFYIDIGGSIDDE